MTGERNIEMRRESVISTVTIVSEDGEERMAMLRKERHLMKRIRGTRYSHTRPGRYSL